MSTDMGHMDHLEAVAAADVEHLREKERTYQGSWKRRGGIGAFMMLARKWDRLEGMCRDTNAFAQAYDIFGHIGALPLGLDGSPLAEVRDLRRYLLLVEAEMVSRGAVKVDKCLPLAPTVPAPTKYTTWPIAGDEEGQLIKVGPMGQPIKEDSNKHAFQPPSYLMDGCNSSDYAKGGVPFIPIGNGTTAIVDRRHYPDNQLPRLQLELNHKEWRDQLPIYRWMYYFENDSAKYLLRQEFREHWGRGS